jgi:hypothetical protein
MVDPEAEMSIETEAIPEAPPTPANEPSEE